MSTNQEPAGEALFDVYLTSGCAPGRLRALERHRRLLGQALDNGQLEKREPGFLRLDLPREEAIEMLKALKGAGARGAVVKAAYRVPGVTLEEAHSRAVGVILRKQAELFPGYTFSPVQLQGEGAMWWSFGSVSQQLVEEGRIPGAVFAHIDKRDGHEWTAHAMENFLESQLAIRAG